MRLLSAPRAKPERFIDRFLLGTGRMPHPVGGDMGVALCTAVKIRGYTRFDIILLNIHKATSRWRLAARLLTFAAWQGTQPTVLQLFLRYSVEIYMCANASELTC